MGMNRNLISEVVCDAGPIIHLDELSSLNLLTDFESVFVPDMVWQEVEFHRPQAFLSEAVGFKRVIVNQIDDPVIVSLVRALSLDEGEQQAILFGRKHPEAMMLTDDAAARLAAERLGIQTHGTIGLLIRAVRRNQREPKEVLAMLKALPDQSSLFIRRQLLDEIVSRFCREFGLHK
jgi:predicted nucleic acid-binding protein